MSKSAVSLLPLAFLLAFGGLAYAQAPTGNISGTVKDQAGAVVPNCNRDHNE